jgi:hypothetical protein
MRMSPMDDGLDRASCACRMAAPRSSHQYRTVAYAARASACHGDSGTGSSLMASAAASRMGPIPPNPKVASSRAADDCIERKPSGRGPSCSAVLTMGSQRRTDSRSPDSAAVHAAQCAATGSALIISSPSRLSQRRTVVTWPEAT